MMGMEDEDNHLDPRRVFYILHNVWNVDGTIGLDWEAQTGSHDLKSLLAQAVDEVDENHGEVYILECRAIRHIKPGKAQVRVMKVRK